MLKPNFVLRAADDGADAGGGTATADAATATAATATATAATDASATTAAAITTTAAKAGDTATAKAGDVKATTEVKATWREDWRETMAAGDEKMLKQLARYASPEAVWQKTRALEQKMSSGELKPVLSKDATADDVKAYREAHGIPETPDKYDLKDVKIDEADRPFIAEVMKAAHGSNQTPEQVKSTVKAWNDIKKAAFDAQATRDQESQKTSEDALRAEWGPEYRRNLNLIHGLLDGSSSQQVKDKLLSGRLSDGTPIGSSPEVMKMLVSLALIQNPTGVVVPGGDAARAEGIKGELEKLQKVPTAKKTAQQSERQLALIDAAMKGGFMDNNGNWKT